MKIDPYKNKETWLAWKEKVRNGIPGISKENSDLILNYLDDMEKGINISTDSKKGKRSYIRLNALKVRMIFMAKQFETRFNIDNMSKLNDLLPNLKVGVSYIK